MIINYACKLISSDLSYEIQIIFKHNYFRTANFFLVFTANTLTHWTYRNVLANVLPSSSGHGAAIYRFHACIVKAICRCPMQSQCDLEKQLHLTETYPCCVFYNIYSMTDSYIISLVRFAHLCENIIDNLVVAHQLKSGWVYNFKTLLTYIFTTKRQQSQCQFSVLYNATFI